MRQHLSNFFQHAITFGALAVGAFFYQQSREFSVHQGELFQCVQQKASVEGLDNTRVIADADGLITSWRPGVTDIFGYQAEEVIGRPVGMLLTPECGIQYSEHHAISIRESADNTVQYIIAQGMHKSGAKIPLYAWLRVKSENERKFVVIDFDAHVRVVQLDATQLNFQTERLIRHMAAR